MPIKEAFAHHRYLFRQMEVVRPSFCLFAVIVAVTSGIATFISNVFLLRYAVNGIQDRLPFQHLAIAFGAWLLIDLFIKSMRYAYQVWRIPLMAHDMHHHFAHLHFKNITIKHLIEEVTGTYEALIRKGITCLANGILLAVMDPVLLLFALIPLLALPLHSYRLRLHEKSGLRPAAVGYAIALLTEVVLEVGGMLYAVYGTVQGTLGWGDCLIAVTAVGSLSHTLLHIPELLTAIRRHGNDAAQFRAISEGGCAQ